MASRLPSARPLSPAVQTFPWIAKYATYEHSCEALPGLGQVRGWLTARGTRCSSLWCGRASRDCNAALFDDCLQLYESPFTDVAQQGPEGLFSSKQVDDLVAILGSVREAAAVAT